MASNSQPTTIEGEGSGGERNREEEDEEEELPPSLPVVAGDARPVMPEDGYQWRKYGQKYIKNINKVRSYFKCRDKRCNVKKKVEWHPLDTANELRIVYEGDHQHGATPEPPSGMGGSDDALIANPYDLSFQYFGSRSQ